MRRPPPDKYRQRRGKRFQDHQKRSRDQRRQLEDYKAKIGMFLAIAETRELLPDEGRELNALSRKVRKLERRIGPSQEFDGPPK